MINRFKIAITNEDFEELDKMFDEVNAYLNKHFHSLTKAELIEIRTLINQAIDVIGDLKAKDQQKIDKLKNSLKYVRD